MAQILKKALKIGIWTTLLLSVTFISVLLFESQDEINASTDNIEEKLNQFYNKQKMGGFAVSVFTPDSTIFSKSFGYA